MKLTKESDFNKIIKRFSQIGPEGSKLGEKMAEKKAKSSSSHPHKQNSQKGLPKKLSDQKGEEKKGQNYSFKKNPEIPTIKKTEIPPNQIKSPIKEFIENEKKIITESKGKLKEKFTEIKFEEEKKEIPNPPPLPAKPLEKVKQISMESITPELLKTMKNNLKKQHEIPYKTKISSDLKEKDITTNEVLCEGILRGLLKIDEKSQSNEKTFTTTDDNEIKVPNQKYNIKLTPSGQAYLKSLQKINENFIKHEIKEYNEKDYEYKLAIIENKEDDKKVIVSGKQTHIVAVIIKNKNSDETYCIGFLTSKALGDEQNDIDLQYFDFQKKMKNQEDKLIETIDKLKPQRFMPTENLEKINKDQIKILKWGSDYIKETKLKFLLIIQQEKIMKVDAKLFLGGHTKKNIIDICKKFDANIKNNQPHPKSLLELFQQEKGLEKQKNILEQKLLKKNQQSNHDKEDE